MPLNSIKAAQLRVWLKTIGAQIGDGTVNEVWGYLSVILQAAVDDERITKNYCRSQTTVRPPSRPERKARAWQKARVLAVREAMPDRFQAMVDIGVGAGLRQGEVFGLAVEDVDEDEGVLHVRRQVKKIGAKLVYALPKGRKTRTVPVPPYLLARIAAHMAGFPPQKVELPWGTPTIRRRRRRRRSGRLRRSS